jgi:putative PIN family toxin of toxin-antitoxin system
VRAVIDTNVLVSGLFWHGAPHVLVEHARSGTLSLISSPALLAELADVIRRPKFRTKLAQSKIDAEKLLTELWQLAEVIDPPPLSAPISRDIDDDAVLALATASLADLIISGDEDLLSLGSHAGIPIVTAANALVKIAREAI